MRASFTKTESRIAPRLDTVKSRLKILAPKAFAFFRSKTPVDSGNARNKTKLQGDTIQADYPYATRLDQGYSSQARTGMSRPTISYIRQQLLRQIFGR